jgi:hypothetical protein
MKKLLVYGPIAMALIASLAVGIPAAVAADTSDEVSTETTTATDEQRPGQEIFSRVAEILNIDEETLKDAFQQATQEMMTERQQEHLQNAVDNGLITEEEAAEIQEWWDSKPAALEKLAPVGGQNQFMGPRGIRGPAVASDTVPANTSNTDEQKPGEEILSNVANILGIDETVLSDAFQQAAQELGIGPLGDQGRGQMMGPADDFAFCAP